MRKLLLIMLLCCSIGAFAQEQRVSMSMHNVTVKAEDTYILLPVVQLF